MAEERVKPRSMYVEEAIQFALESRWADALAVNQALIERHGADEDTYNRLGKALTELTRLDDALAAYSSALQLNPLNLIAQKNVRKLSLLRESKETLAAGAQAIDADAFTEEPGKSALTVLNPPSEAVTVKVAPGDVVELEPDGSALRARTSRGVALGEVEAKLARRLVPLIQTGNRYKAAVARVDDGKIEIIVREAYQAPENTRKSSFPLSKSARREEFRPYAKDSLLSAREIDADQAAEEEDEPGADPAQELEQMGMSTFQAEADEEEPDDGGDDDTRPEDEY